MIFSSTLFLVYFLPSLLVLYAIIPRQLRNYLLLAASIFFYCWGAPRFIFVVLGTTLLDFFLVARMHNTSGLRLKRMLMITSISVNLGLLFYFKYFNFFAGNVASLLGIEYAGIVRVVLPLAISFYTFETVTYVVDVYRGKFPPQKNFADYLLYILFFPKMILGPIIAYNEIAAQLSNRIANEKVSLRINGFVRFSIGLAKKVLIADLLSVYVSGVFSEQLQDISALNAWIGAIAFVLRLYFDFSGYSDMAIGLGKMFGFRLPENFNNPFTAGSLTEFWRRWHITLGNWMKNYLYIPLGGNQVSTKRLLFNLWLVFLLSGLWHGASWNFVIWGAAHGAVILVERLFLLKVYARMWKIFPILITFGVVVMTGVFFNTESVEHALKVFGLMFGASAAEFVLPGREFIVVFILAIFFSFFAVFKWGRTFQQVVFGDSEGFTTRLVLSLTAIMLYCVSLSFVTAAGVHPFIYFRF